MMLWDYVIDLMSTPYRTFGSMSGEFVRANPGGGYLTKFCTGRLRPEVQPLTLSYNILAERVPLLNTFF